MNRKRLGSITILATLVAVFYLSSKEHGLLSPDCEQPKTMPELAGTTPKALSEPEISNVNRFIAHAGGSIDGLKYTNSLEALENSYKNGFRLFELDIIETSDNKWVAAHDWERWRRWTDYAGELPPTLASFKTHQVLGKYTSLDLDGINSWFDEHPDSILVTDQVNEPAEFSSMFVDKSRLMMELFTLEAVKEGIKAGIKSAMPSWIVLDELGCDVAVELATMGVTDVAASRRVQYENAGLLRQLKSSGIRVYAFQLNSDSWDNEQFVICHEMNYFYGIYADDWDFGTTFSCSDSTPKL